MSQLQSSGLVFVFFIFLWIPLAGTIFEVSMVYGEIEEKRILADFPEFATEKLEKWPRLFEKYYDDNFGFRSQFVTFNSVLRHKLLQLANRRVVFGKHDWMFLIRGRSGSALDQYRGVDRFSHKNLQSFFDVMKIRSDWFDSQGVKFLFVAVPNKSTIYPEFLPDWVQKSGPSHLDQIQAYIEENGERFPYIDLRSCLLRSKGRGPLYEKTGTHWNMFGSYFAYRTITDRLRMWFPELRPLTEEDLLLLPESLDQGQDLAQLFGIRNLFVEPHSFRLKLKRPSRVVETKSWVKGQERDVSAPGRARFETLVTSNASAMPKVLFIRDSFASTLFPYMNETFSKSHYVSNKAFLFDDRVFRRMKPDIVVVVWSERALIPIGKSEVDFLDPGFAGFPLE